MAPHYASLRQCLARLGGLLLLCCGGTRPRVEELAATLEQVSDTRAQAAEALRAPRVAPALEPVRRDVLAAAELVGEAVIRIGQGLRTVGGGIDAAEQALPLLRRAHRLLLANADPAHGMVMVGFGHACCGAAAAGRDGTAAME